jgi:hypothetical protein
MQSETLTEDRMRALQHMVLMTKNTPANTIWSIKLEEYKRLLKREVNA